MAQGSVKDTVNDVPSLRAVFVTAMPDCLLYDSWVRPEESWAAEDAASYFGDLVRANREGLRALKSWSAEMQVTIESADVLLIVRELRSDFVVTLAFMRDVPLGMVRLHAKRVMERLDQLLPTLEAQQRPRAVKITEFLEKYAPDPHAALHRVALRTGIPLGTLRKPESLETTQVALLEASVCDILGLESLSL